MKRLPSIIPILALLALTPRVVRAADEPSSPWAGAVAVFDYRVRDVEAAVRFYRDGLAMREVRSPQGDTILEWAGGCLRFQASQGAIPPTERPGNPFRQIMAANGYRYVSLFLHDVAAAEARLVEAGYPRPRKGGRVSVTYDPDGNVVEFVPRPASRGEELLTVGVIVADEEASRAFYGEKLGLTAERPMRLPGAMHGKQIYPYSIGAARVKLFEPEGQRTRDGDAAGIRGLTILVPNLEAARDDLDRRGVAMESLGDGGFAIRDPDGNRIQLWAKGDFALPAGTLHEPAVVAKRAEIGPPEAGERRSRGFSADAILERYDRNGDGALDRDEFEATRFGRRRPERFAWFDRDQDGRITREELATLRSRGGGAGRQPGRPRAIPSVKLGPPEPQIDESRARAPGEPPLRKARPGDAGDDAKGRGQLFESVVVPGFTDIVEGTNGIALVDLNRDGLVDVVATYSPPRGSGRSWQQGERLRVFANEGEFRFRPHQITLRDSPVSLDRFGRGQVPNLADFNGDGWLDLFVTRHAPTSAGVKRRGIEPLGNSLFLTDGAWDVFRDVSDSAGIRNETAYNRQPCFGDINRDGRLDVAIGCDNIKNAFGGFPHSRLYVYTVGHVSNVPRHDGIVPHEVAEFDQGRYEDIGGTDRVPDFGGFYHDSDRDRAGPDINLVDLDNDGDLDLMQNCHIDVREPLLPYWPGEYRQGVFCWKNLLDETGNVRFEKITGNGLACEARLRYDRREQRFRAEGKAPGLPYVAFADVDNDGLADVLAVGPASPGWAPRAEYVGGRFWRNRGGFQFEEATQEAGLGPLNWTMREWLEFYDAPTPDRWRSWPPRGRRGYESQPGLARRHPGESIPYFADAAFADFDNDGWIDLVVMDRSENPQRQARQALFMNQGDGTFALRPTDFSGLDAAGISAEAADLNNDGLVDLVSSADPDNSGLALTPDRYQDKVYWNTGLHGARDNHWLRLRFRGVSDAELIGARVEVTESGGKSSHSPRRGTRWIHSNHSYKSGGALEAHFGLGGHDRVDLKVVLPSGRTCEFRNVEANRFLDLDLKANEIATVTGGA